MSPMTCAYFKH